VGPDAVDILINNAGVYPFGPTHETTEESFDKVYSLNVKVPYFLVAELAPLMAKRGKGAIVNLSTMVANYGAPGMSLYGSSKACPCRKLKHECIDGEARLRSVPKSGDRLPALAVARVLAQ
jgi:NADP-dependent 3-hydroxy acid dehydrogenase YdfG